MPLSTNQTKGEGREVEETNGQKGRGGGGGGGRRDKEGGCRTGIEGRQKGIVSNICVIPDPL